MPIHIEAITVIVRGAAMSRVGFDRSHFKSELGNATFATDGALLRGAFMCPSDAENFIRRLEFFGLVYVVDESAKDIAVADQIHGPASPARWLTIYPVQLPHGEWISCAKLSSDERTEVVFPEGWRYQNSLYVDAHFVPTERVDRILPISTQSGVDTVVDLESGALLHCATPSVARVSERGLPTLVMAHDEREVFLREEACIDLLKSDALAGKQPMSDLIMPSRRWWRPNPKRREVYVRPLRRTVDSLATLYAQTYRPEMLSAWIGIFYGDQASRYYWSSYKHMMSIRSRENVDWEERHGDWPNPTRIPVAALWLDVLTRGLPDYDSALLKPAV